MEERFKIEIIMPGSHLLEFGDFVNAICVEFPASVAAQVDQLVSAASSESPDLPAIRAGLAALSSNARNASMVGDAVAKTIGGAHPVRLNGGASAMRASKKISTNTHQEDFAQTQSMVHIELTEAQCENFETAMSEAAYALNHAQNIFHLLKRITPHNGQSEPGIHSVLHMCFIGFEAMSEREGTLLDQAEFLLRGKREEVARVRKLKGVAS